MSLLVAARIAARELLAAARIAARELRGGLRGFRVFLLCLILGVAAIAAIGSVRTAIETGLSEQGAVLLGGDAEVQLTYRFATPEERAWLDQTFVEVSEIADFRSMLVAGEGAAEDRGLTQVKAIDGAYPLYGTVALSPEMPLDQALEGDGSLPGAVIAPALADRLGIGPGATVQLGGQSYRIMALLTREPDDSGGGFMLGPRTIVSLASLRGSGLLAPGTLFESAYRLRLPEGMTLDQAKAATKAAIGEGHRWRDARNGAPGIAQFVERLGAFLILVGLAGLAVGGVGIAAAVRSYLDGKSATIATLKTLGAGRATVFWVYALQIAVLTVAGIVAGLALGALAPWAVAPFISGRVPFDLATGLYLRPLAEAALYGALTATIFSLWPLARAQDLRAAALYRGAALGAEGWPRWPYLLLIAGLVGALYAAATLFSGAPRLATATLGGVLATLVVLGLLGLGARHLARALKGRALQGRPALRLALGAVGGPGRETVATMLALGLGLSVLATVGQIDSNLRRAISTELPENAPAYFVVDIQNVQLEGFLGMARGAEGVTKVETAPMLRGVITRINDRPATEVAGDHWVIRGDRGVTYSADLPANTKLTAGEWWPENYTGPPLISFSAEEAGEIGLKIGDKLTVNILGRDITGTIASFREVDFSTAGIGFVMAMNPSALAAAPHSHIATLYAEPQAEGPAIRALTKAFPNITAIRVRDAIDRVVELVSTIAAATSLGASVTLITGVVVLIGAMVAGEPARRYEAAVLKSLGAVRGQILTTFTLRFLLIGAIAGLAALLVGAIAAWAVMTFVMDAGYAFDPVSGVAVIGTGLILTLATSLWFTLRALAIRPAAVLRAQE